MRSDHPPLPSSAAPSPVSRWTVAALALVLTAADGFLATSLRGAAGYIQNTQQPFRDWVLYLAVMVPIFAATILGALWLGTPARPARGATRCSSGPPWWWC